MNIMMTAAMHLAIAAFTPWFAERGVNVEIARTKGEIPWIRGTFELPVPPEKVAAVVSNFERDRSAEVER